MSENEPMSGWKMQWKIGEKRDESTKAKANLVVARCRTAVCVSALLRAQIQSFGLALCERECAHSEQCPASVFVMRCDWICQRNVCRPVNASIGGMASTMPMHGDLLRCNGMCLCTRPMCSCMYANAMMCAYFSRHGHNTDCCLAQFFARCFPFQPLIIIDNVDDSSCNLQHTGTLHRQSVYALWSVTC